LNRILIKALTVGLCGALLGCGLVENVTLEAFNLQVVPTPAQEGDLVSFDFRLNVAASAPVSLSALIDGEEYSTQTVPSFYSGVFTWEIGDAADLIARFDLGDHTAQVRIRESDGGHTAATEQVTFTLVAPVP
jgi:hypothetical protein